MANFFDRRRAILSAILLIAVVHFSPTLAESDQVLADRCLKNLSNVRSFKELSIFLDDLDDSVRNYMISSKVESLCTGLKQSVVSQEIRRFRLHLGAALKGDACAKLVLLELKGSHDVYNESPLKLWWNKFVLQVSAQCEQSLVGKLLRAEKIDKELGSQLRVALLFAQNFHQKNSKSIVAATKSLVSRMSDRMSLDEIADQLPISHLRELAQYDIQEVRKSEEVHYEFKLLRNQYEALEMGFKACDNIAMYKYNLIDYSADLNLVYGIETNNSNSKQLKKWLAASEICQIIRRVQVYTQVDDDKFLNVHLY